MHWDLLHALFICMIPWTLDVVFPWQQLLLYADLHGKGSSTCIMCAGTQVLATSHHAGRGIAHQLKLDSGSDASDLLSTSQSETSDEDMASNEEEAGGLGGKVADVEMATTSGIALWSQDSHILDITST